MKSLLILAKDNNENNLFMYKAYKLFSQYLKDNQPNIKPDIYELIKKKWMKLMQKNMKVLIIMEML